MTNREQPREGGSYLRQPDGSLKRLDAVTPSSETPVPPAEQKTPARSPKRTKE